MNIQFSDNFDFIKNIMGVNSKIIDITNSAFIDIENEIENDTITKLIPNYEVLGEYNFKKKIWYWSYILPKYNSILTSKARQLLNYGAKIDESNNNEQLLIKNLLINSTIKIKEYINIIFIINIAQYLLKNIKTIYKKKTNDTIIYYIVKYNNI